MTALKVPPVFHSGLRCPICGAQLEQAPAAMICLNLACAHHFPIIDGVPILINEAQSVFALDDYRQGQDTYFSSKPHRLRRLRQRLLPSISANINSAAHYRDFITLLHQQVEVPRILVIGGGIIGQGMEELIAHPPQHLLESDVSIGPRTALVCDAHDLPFVNETFDGVIAQAVLEHVVEPVRCAQEIHRVLKPTGLVYAETPFMQQVHGGRYDFTRFTHLGHRRLFRHFDEIDSGVICGPGMALAWSYRYFLLSFVSSPLAFRLVDAFAHLTAFWLKYLDRRLDSRPAALDAASGLYFLGRRSDTILEDKELIRGYRGRG